MNSIEQEPITIHGELLCSTCRCSEKELHRHKCFAYGVFSYCLECKRKTSHYVYLIEEIIDYAKKYTIKINLTLTFAPKDINKSIDR